MRVLGIDPGLRRTGFGVIDADGSRLRYVASGTIVVPPALTLSERLKVILTTCARWRATRNPTSPRWKSSS